MVSRLACILHATHLLVAVSIVSLTGNVEEVILQIYLSCISPEGHHETLLIRQVYDSTCGAK